MAKIKQITAREILNSKAFPTIETTVILSDNSIGVASVPTGSATGTYEAKELRDGDMARYQGKGVLQAIDKVNTIIAPALVGKEASNLADIDKALIQLDGTQNKSLLGANTMLSVSMSAAKAAAKSAVLPLYLYLNQYQKKDTLIKIPTPIFNVINGGVQAGNNLNFQEFMYIPATSKPFKDSLVMSAELYHALKNVLSENNLITLTGDEGGYGPTLTNNIDAFALMKKAVETTKYKFGFDVFFGLDAAANNFYKDHHYFIKDKATSFSSKDMINYYEELNRKYPLIYIEDPLSTEDWEGWTTLCSQMAQHTLVVGDSITETNPYRLQMAISKNAISGAIIKPNQIGTVIETLAVIEVTRAAGLKITISHGNSETNDDFIADLAVATGADYIKCGAPAHGERVAKYNRLLQLEEQINVTE